MTIDDDFADGAADRVAVLRALLSGTLSSGRSLVSACPLLTPKECRGLRDHLRSVELVRLSDGTSEQLPLPAALTLDGTMSPYVLASTICAVLRLDEAGRV